MIVRTTIVLIAVLAAWATLGTRARSQGHHHPPQDAAIHDQFYATWMRPDDRTLSCCNKADCYPTEAKYDGDLKMWLALHRETGRWIPIPATKVEDDRDSPDGRNHACISPQGFVYCFIAGNGS